MNQILTRFRVMVCLGLSLLTFFFFNVNAAFAHIPHDTVIETKLSPNYAQDRTVYHIVDVNLNTWGNLFKSENKGQSWQRIEEGLDNQYQLSSLDIASESPDTLFVSTFGNGIYQSKNGGQSWQKVNQGLENLNIKQVLISPHSSDLVLAIGSEKGLYQTKDEGKNWFSIMGNHQVTAVAYFPNLENQIVIGDSQGKLYLSKDQGENWQPLFDFKNSGIIRDLKISPNFASDQTFFVGTEKEGIFKTLNGGQSFQAVNQGISDRSIAYIAISPNYQKDATLFVSAWKDGLFQSHDGGISWQKSNKGLTTQVQALNWNSPHFSKISLSPNFAQDQTIFVAGFDGLFKSVDGGWNWQDTNIAFSRANNIHQIALSPNYANDQTLAISTLFNSPYISHNQGKTWTNIEQGVQIDGFLKQHLLTNIISLEFSPNYRFDQTLLASTFGGLFKTNNRGKNWEKHSVPESLKATSYMLVSPDYKTDQTVYLITYVGDFLRSTDGGQNFTPIGKLKGHAIQPPALAISPNFSVDQTLYLGGFAGGIHKSVDGGVTWHSVSNNPAIEGANKIKLVISPNYQVDQTVFAGTSRGLFVTHDGGLNWAKLVNETAHTNSNVADITISPNYQNDQTFLLNLKGQGLFKTTDAGKSFLPIRQALHGPIEFSPSYSTDQTIYAATDATLVKSTNGGLTWQKIQIDYRKYNLISILYLIITNAPERKIIFSLLLGLLSYLIFRFFKVSRKRFIKKSSPKIVLP